MTRPLVTEISGVAGQPATVRIGLIASVDPVTVTVQGAVFTNVGFLQGWTFHEGETVALLGQSNASGSDPASWLVLPASGDAPLGYQTGVALVSFTALGSFTQAVTFPQPFASAPNVHLNINSGAGATAQWHSRAISITPTGFTIFVFQGTGLTNTWTNIPVAWSAFPQPL